jgi:putative transcriptional regulator
MKSLQGQLLIATPYNGDGRFEQAVILMLHHDAQGAFGVILNRPLDETVGGLWKMLGDPTCQLSERIHLGGPVSGPIIAIHSLESMGDFQVSPGLQVAEQRDSLQRLVHHSDGPLRVYVGHAGWGSGQLEAEIAQEAWYTLPADASHVFEDTGNLWVDAVREVGRDFWRTTLGLREFPEDVTMN